MAEVSIRDLRNEGGKVLDEVSRGATVTVTRQGRPIAELRPLRRGTRSADLIAAWRGAPTADFDRLRADLTAVIDDAL